MIKARCLDTHGFIPKKIQWHIQAGPWSLVNCWREGSYEALYNMLMNINEAAVGLEDGLGLDGDRCIRMIPRQQVILRSVESILRRIFKN